MMHNHVHAVKASGTPKTRWISPETMCRMQQYVLFGAVLSAIGFVRRHEHGP